MADILNLSRALYVLITLPADDLSCTSFLVPKNVVHSGDGYNIYIFREVNTLNKISL